MKKILLIISVLFGKLTAAQHEHHMHGDDTSAHNVPMCHAFSLNLPMTRNGSGTGWLPDSTPMYGYMVHAKKWMLMFHGNVFVRHTKTDLFNAGTRGARKTDAVNWFMGMGQRKIGKKGLFRFSAMLSLDNLFGGNGYPLLFQTGETWQGKPLVDRQHPHDLFSELSMAYTHSIDHNLDVFVYAAYPGEPALGSVAFMHRVSSLYSADAPLSHHWNDGTHITFGVLTGGIRFRQFKFDVSNFTGREPDENRYNFDRPRFDSYSARLSYNPNPFWSFQVSRGFVKSPEFLRPREDVYRTTAAAVYSKPLRNNSFLNATALWGLNKSHAAENAFLLEGVYVVNRWAVFSRYEYVQKGVHELALDEQAYEHDALFNVNAVTVGFNFDFLQSRYLRMALGVQGSYYATDERLQTLYGKNPASGQVFVRIYPPRMNINRR
ncbi:MAG TPA: hypothetical protein VD905_13540 [Flavobacteriales bacterium]|nr:hypothetical protein [Flavobacteriales bacterium]